MQDARQTMLEKNASVRKAHALRCSYYASITSVLTVFVWMAVLGSPAVANDTKTGPGPGDISCASIVRLYPTAVVTSNQVTLADIAEIKGDSADLISDWAISSAPQVGGTLVIGQSQLQKVLANRGMNLAMWMFRGSSKCTVKRPTESPPRQSSSLRKSHRSPLHSDEPLDGNRERHAVVHGRVKTLEDALRQYVSQRLVNYGGTPSIRFSSAAKDLLAMSRPTYDFRIVSRNRLLGNIITFEVTIYENGKLKQTESIMAEVTLNKNVIVAAGPISKGKTIKASDLTHQERNFKRIEDLPKTDTSSLIGQRAKRFIRGGSIIYSDDIEAVPLVSRNDIVTVVARCGSLKITTTAIAKESGSMGQRITLKNPVSKEEFDAVVDALKAVRIDESGSRTVATLVHERGAQ